jgi:hypothetical protein
MNDNIIDLRVYENANNLKIYNWENISDFSAYRNIHTLDLSDCIGITDVSALGNFVVRVARSH